MRRPRRTRARAYLAAIAAVLGTTALTAAPLTSEPARAFISPNPTAVSAVTAESVRVSIAPEAAGVLGPGQDLALTVRVDNNSSEIVTGAFVDVSVSAHLAAPEQLQEWVDGDAVSSPSARVTVPDVPKGSGQEIRVTVPAGSLGVTEWGSYGLAAQLVSGAASVSAPRTAFVYAPGPAPANATVTTIVPFVVPGVAGGLLPAAQLEELLGETGPLGRALEAVANQPVTIALDPRIIASVRVLGPNAPTVATEWLQRLAAVTNEIFPLQYGDADPVIQRESGIFPLLAPTSFAYASTAATPDTTTSEPSSPLAWGYSASGILWPGLGTLETADLEYFASSGYTTVIADSTTLIRETSGSATTVNLGPTRVLVTNNVVSRGLSTSASSASAVERSAGLALANAGVATSLTASEPGAPVALLSTVSRDWLDNGSVSWTSAQALTAMPWIQPGSLDSIMSLAPASGGEIITPTEDVDRINTVSEMFGNEIQIRTFSSVLADPQLVTGRVRNDLLAALAIRYRTEPEQWREAVDANIARSAAVLDSVKVVDGSSINLLTSEADIPVTVSNDLPYPVTVTVTVTPSNGRLVVDDSIEVTIEGDSRATARIPVKAGVANGTVSLTPRLYTPDGVLISQGTPVTVNVSADWEGIGAAGLAVLIGGFFAFSLTRLIVIRRRARREEQVE